MIFTRQYRRIIIILGAVVFLFSTIWRSHERQITPPAATTAAARIISYPFTYSFAVDAVLEETLTPDESNNPYWWLSSGGQILIRDGVGQTINGDLPVNTRWREIYRRTNPRDTDSGRHPQNLLRLHTRQTWKNFTQEIRVKINKVWSSESPNRNESNGVFLLHRYQNSDNLYYAGLRVDHNAVIKKKKDGVYHTLGLTAAPSKFVERKWLDLRTEITSSESNKVRIVLWIDGEKVLEATDHEDTISKDGMAGLRSDFMDLEFDDYRITKLD